MKFMRKKIKDTRLKLIDGDRGSNYPKQNDFFENGYCLFLNTGNVREKGFLFSDTQFISKEKDAKLRKGKLQANDIVLTTRGTVGNVAFFDERVPFGNVRINSGMLIIRSDITQFNPKFLTYLFQSSLLQQQIKAYSSGSAQPQLPVKDLKNITLVYPYLEFQQHIADILSAYDELIENNNQRIAILEQMAEQIYKEWFVRFRFPGYENTKFIKGIPEGWGILTLNDLCEFNRKSISKRTAPEVVQYVDISSVTTNNIDEITELSFTEAPSRARRRVVDGDIIWSSVRPANRAYARVISPPKNLIVSTGFIVISPKNAPSSFLYYSVTSDSFVDHISSVAKGAAYPAAGVEDFETSQILLPSAEVLEKFDRIVKPNHILIENLKAKSSYLKKTRDLLLPRLISGKLSVERAEAQTSEAATELTSAGQQMVMDFH